jgi:hypothetical protein
MKERSYIFIQLFSLLAIVLITIFYIFWSYNHEKKADVIRKTDKFRVIELEGCEYFYTTDYHGNYVLCHKGNCKNPVHIYNNPY